MKRPALTAGISHAVGHSVSKAGEDAEISSGLLTCAVEGLDVSGIGRAAFDLRNDVNEPALADREPSHAVNSAIPSLDSVRLHTVHQSSSPPLKPEFIDAGKLLSVCDGMGKANVLGVFPTDSSGTSSRMTSRWSPKLSRFSFNPPNPCNAAAFPTIRSATRAI